MRITMNCLSEEEEEQKKSRANDVLAQMIPPLSFFSHPDNMGKCLTHRCVCVITTLWIILF